MTSFRLSKSAITAISTTMLTLQMSACTVEENIEKIPFNTTVDITSTSGDFDNSSGDFNNAGSGIDGSGDGGSEPAGSTGSGHIAIISGNDKGSVTEDDDPDRDNLLEATGRLNITDADAGEAGFVSSTQRGSYGNLKIATAGDWNYTASNSQAAIQSMSQGDSLKESFTVSSIDGTTHSIVITLYGADDAAMISGQDSGSVTEDIDPDRDSLLEASGRLSIIDADTGEAGFVSSTQRGSYGDLSIDATGYWRYTASNSQAAIQDMDRGDALQETFTVSSIDGTMHDLSISILGDNEPIADISLSWDTPVEREDNTPLLLSDIAGYRVYVYRDAQGELTDRVDIDDSGTLTYTFRNFSSGTYHFIISSVDSLGRESLHGAGITVII